MDKKWSRRRRILRVARAAGALDRAPEFLGGRGRFRAAGPRVEDRVDFGGFRGSVRGGGGRWLAVRDGGGGLLRAGWRHIRRIERRGDGSRAAESVLTGTARGFAEAAVDGTSSLSLSRLEGSMVMMSFRDL